jgi:hypothetical protein
VNSSAAVWASRGGVQPLAVPVCGFDGNGCPQSTFEQYKVDAGTLCCAGTLLMCKLAFILLQLTPSLQRAQNVLAEIWLKFF